MRTKTLLLTAALVAAGVATSMAQSNVYSLNVVGYVNVPIKKGFNIVVNPLDNGSGNILSNVINNATLDALPDGSLLYPWQGGAGGYGTIQTYFNGFGWFDPGYPDGTITNHIAPGQGFFLFTSADTNVTFVGTVTQGTTTNNLGHGFTLTGSTEPLSVPVGAAGDGLGSATMQLPVVDGDLLYLFTPGTNAGHGYNITTYFGGYGWFDPSFPGGTGGPTNGAAPAVGQGFFTFKTGAATPWVQSYTVQ